MYDKVRLLIFFFASSALLLGADDAFKVERRKVDYSDGYTRKYIVELYPQQGAHEVAFDQPLDFDTRTLRVHFTVEADPTDSTWFLELRNPDGTPGWTSTEYDRRQGIFWSGEVEGGHPHLMLHILGSDRNVKLRIDQVAVTGIESKPQSITTKYEDMVPVLSVPADIQELGKAITRIRFIGDDGSRYVCTGFLVARDLLMTNEHCFSSSEEALSALIDFDFNTADTKCSVNAAGECKTIRVSKFLWSNFALDYALAKLSSVPEGRAVVPLGPSSIHLGEDLIVIEHPDGQFKKVSLINCQISNKELVQGRGSDKNDFSHLCNTVGGSSGSAVWDRSSHQVIGIHHFGFTPGAVKASNQAVDMGAILDDIFVRDPNVYWSLSITNPKHPKQ